MTLNDSGMASMAYFYFDFRDVDKQKLQDLLTITKLLTVFDVYESEEEALAGFK